MVTIKAVTLLGNNPVEVQADDIKAVGVFGGVPYVQTFEGSAYFVVDERANDRNPDRAARQIFELIK